MFCKTCGSQMPDGAAICANCGAQTGAAAEVAQDTLADQPTVKVVREQKPVPPPPPPPPPSAHASTPAPPPPPGPGGYGAPGGAAGFGTPGGYGVPSGYRPSGRPRQQSRKGLWIGIGVAALIVIAAGVTVPLLLMNEDDDKTSTGTTRISVTTSTAVAAGSTDSTSTASSDTTSSSTTSTSSTTTTIAGPPMESPGAWVEIEAPETPEGTYTLSLSDRALLMESNSDTGYELTAYLLETGDIVRLPVGGGASPSADVDGLLAVWQEAAYDPDTYEYYDRHVYALLLPDGVKVEVAAGGDTHAYPQVALPWISWTWAEPWESNPEEYYAEHINLIRVNGDGNPVGEPDEVVSMAPAYMYGEGGWVYCLSSRYLAWENHAPHHLTDMGTSVTDITDEEGMPLTVGIEAWRPTIGGDTIVYWDTTLMATDLESMATQELDPLGDFATAGPTFAAYYRSIETADDWTYEIVVKGYVTGDEQVLAETDLDPYFSAPIAVSARHAAFLVDDVVRLFEWQPR